MRVAHFGNFAPYRAGMFHSTCDQIMAERLVGIDAQFIDWSQENPERGQFYSRVGLKFDDITTITPEWAKSADVLVHHWAMPADIANTSIPVVMVIHARPEYSFMLEYTGQGPVFSEMASAYGANSQYKAFMVIGDEYVDVWKRLLETKAIVQPIPLMVDLKKYNPWGDKHPLGDGNGSPNIIIADKWRYDVTPFYLLMAAAKFIKEECPTGKLHVFGLPNPKNAYISTLIKPLMRQGVIGRALTNVENMDKLYRTVDFLITPNNVSNRIIRESLASGCPILAAPGCKFTDYTAYSGDIDGCVEVMKRLWKDIQANSVGMSNQARKTAEENFSFEKTGTAALKIYKEVLKNEKKHQVVSGWIGKGTQKRCYKSYQEYLSHQKSKLDQGIDFLKDYDVKYRKGLGERLVKLDYIKGTSVLCLGARIGTEVKAFLDNGAFAVGLDLNPGKNNKYVVTGDFHDLNYADESVDILFTNSIDHVFDIEKVLNEAYRVLKPAGKFMVDAEKRTNVGVDRWSSFWWKNNNELIKLLKANKFKCIKKSDISCLWFTEQLIFEKC